MYPNKLLIKQFFRYALVGGVASVADISIYIIGVNLFGINHLLANTISLTVGLAVNYALSSKWVFEIHTHMVTNFFLFSVIGLIGFALSNALLYVLIDLKVLYSLLLTSNENLLKTLAKLIVTGIVLIWNFAARRKLVFS